MKPVRHIRPRNRIRQRNPHPMKEQARLDGEMFDGVTQSLFSLTLTLRAARRGMPQASEETEHLLDSAEELAQHALSELCALTFELRPEAREVAGLAQSLQTHVGSLQARTGHVIHLSVKGDRRLPFELEEVLYQLVRSTLNEVVRRAEATEAWVELHLEGENVYISIRDNGRSPVFSALNGPALRTRIEALGGTVEVKQHKEGEAEVVVGVPGA